MRLLRPPVVGAAAVLSLLPLARGQPAPPWVDRVRAAAVARALEPLEGDALTAARVEAARATAAGLPQLRLGERSRLGLDASFTLELEAGASVPLWAPAVEADRRLTRERLAATRQQLAAERRAALHDTLANAVALLATRARLRALDALAGAVAAQPPAEAQREHGSGRQGRDAAPARPDPDSTARAARSQRPPSDRRAVWVPPVSPVDVQLLLAQRSAQQRRDRVLRAELQARLGVRVPGPPPTAEAGPAVADPTVAGPTVAGPTVADGGGEDRGPGMAWAPRPAEAPYPARDPLGLVAAELEPAACLAGNDAVAQAWLAAEDRRLSAALSRARAAPHADLELSGAATFGNPGVAGTGTGGTGAGGGLQDAAYAVRVGLSVSLPPWRPATGAASVTFGAAGLEQSLSAAWPNRTPAAPPAADARRDAAGRSELDPDVREAQRTVRRQLELLVGQEADLLVRRRILLQALDTPRPATPAGAYRTATLALRLADTDEGLGLTRLDAAQLCGALPP